MQSARGHLWLVMMLLTYVVGEVMKICHKKEVGHLVFTKTLAWVFYKIPFEGKRVEG